MFDCYYRMGDHKILLFNWRSTTVDIKVEIDKCTLLDLVVEYEDEAKRRGIHLTYAYPTFAYVFEMDHHYLLTDAQLMTMFERCQKRDKIDIWIGTNMKPNPLYKLVMNLRRQNEAKKSTKVGGNAEHEQESDGLPSLNDLEDTSVKPKTKTKPNPKPKTKPKAKTKTKVTSSLPPPNISPNTAFKNLTVRRSPRFSPAQNTNNDSTSANASINAPPSDQSLFGRKVPRTTAIRKGLPVESGSSGKTAKRKVDFQSDGEFQTGDQDNNADESAHVYAENNSDSSDGEVVAKGTCPSDEDEEVVKVPKIKENWKQGSWHEFIDDENDDSYYQKLYKNGEIYEDKEFGKIALKPWMIFLDKNHYKKHFEGLLHPRGLCYHSDCS